jgi:hypothetical protein
MKTKVKQLRSRNGNQVANQFEITQTKKDYQAHIFQSYDTIISKIIYSKGKRIIYLDKEAFNYSRTTSKYLYQFMMMNKKEIENLITNKKAIFKNLNK